MSDPIPPETTLATDAPTRITALVIGGGPAGLMAAEMLARAGVAPVVVDQMPTVGRKLLMAGKSGLNLTKSEDAGKFHTAYGAGARALSPALTAFGPDDVVTWAEGLGQSVFTGSTGRIFPKAMKASPLLRAWLARLTELGTTFHTRWRWMGEADGVHSFDTPDGVQRLCPDVMVLALGGASWARLGSDGTWVQHMPGGALAPFAPANAAIRVDWSDHMRKHFGTPLKSIAFSAGAIRSRGEGVITSTGIEGGGIYTLTPALRDGASLLIDLLPDLDIATIRTRLAKRRKGDSLANHLRRSLKLDAMARAMLMEWARPLPDDLAPLIKALPVPVAGLAPLTKAISTAGGVRFDALDPELMLIECPGTFVAGEMLDWEAPTGGYLLTACLATGRLAGLSAVARLKKL